MPSQGVTDAAGIALDCRNCLGESPVWDERTQTLYWVNIHDREVWAWSSQSAQPHVLKLPQRPGAIGLCDTDDLVVALEAGFALLDPRTGELRSIAELPDAPEATRLNDGRVDPAGRFVCGGMNEATPQRANAALFALEAGGQRAGVRHLLSGIACSNAICWSPDGATLYFSDMPTRRIDAFDYDVASGALARRRTFAELGGAGAPDGSIVDAQGHVWNAQWGGGKLVRYRPDGSVEREIALPVSNPTCMAFGGPDLDILFITSAWFTLDGATREREPHAGSLFWMRPGVRGLPAARFRASALARA